MIKYTFRTDEPLAFKNAKKADAQTIGAALEAIALEHGGRLCPKDVAQAARKRTHPLHPHFEWDDAVAAEAYRADQARAIIRVVRVENEAVEGGTSRAFVSVADKGGVSYHAAAEVAGSVELQLAVLKAAERDLHAFERRYKELNDICETVRSARESVQERRQQAEVRAAV